MEKPISIKTATLPGEGLVDVLVPTAFATMAVLNKIGAENDLSLTLIRVLGILWDRRPRMTELADYLGLEKQTMSGLIARAEKRGLVARAANAQDGRATDVFLTSAGARLVQHLHLQTQQALAPLIERLGTSDQRLLQDLLERMMQAGTGPDVKGGD
jgi:DNA-binding MarR family transcriptional regulator